MKKRILAAVFLFLGLGVVVPESHAFRVWATKPEVTVAIEDGDMLERVCAELLSRGFVPIGIKNAGQCGVRTAINAFGPPKEKSLAMARTIRAGELYTMPLQSPEPVGKETQSTKTEAGKEIGKVAKEEKEVSRVAASAKTTGQKTETSQTAIVQKEPAQKSAPQPQMVAPAPVAPAVAPQATTKTEKPARKDDAMATAATAKVGNNEFWTITWITGAFGIFIALVTGIVVYLFPKLTARKRTLPANWSGNRPDAEFELGDVGNTEPSHPQATERHRRGSKVIDLVQGWVVKKKALVKHFDDELKQKTLELEQAELKLYGETRAVKELQEKLRYLEPFSPGVFTLKFDGKEYQCERAGFARDEKKVPRPLVMCPWPNGCKRPIFAKHIMRHLARELKGEKSLEESPEEPEENVA